MCGTCCRCWRVFDADHTVVLPVTRNISIVLPADCDLEHSSAVDTQRNLHVLPVDGDLTYHGHGVCRYTSSCVILGQTSCQRCSLPLLQRSCNIYASDWPCHNCRNYNALPLQLFDCRMLCFPFLFSASRTTGGQNKRHRTGAAPSYL